MRLQELVARSGEIAATPARSRKVELVAELLGRVPPGEVAVAVAFLSGRLVQRQIGVGWATLSAAPAPAPEPALTLAEVDAALAAVGTLAGPGSAGARRAAVGALLGRATAEEQAFLTRLMGGELRQGAQEGVMVDALARASGRPVAQVRRALMLGGDLGEVAALALAGPPGALAEVGLRVMRPVLPMLAGTAADVGDALERLGPCTVEWKADGVRAQIHRRGGEVAVFTRTLDDITARVPELAAFALALPADSLVLDAEAIALRPDGRPRPFQETAARVGRRAPGRAAEAAPLTPFVFDVLHVDGEDLLDHPLRDRAARLDALVPAEARVPRADVADADEAAAVLADAVARGHEGVMAKDPAAAYEAGRRGGAWLKVKPRHTFDLVVLAAEWGHGRRTGWLSNIHLGARADDGDGFVMLGKTFKGMTDEMLAWQTAELLARETGRSGHVVHVRPELVVEIAIDGAQTSTRYPGGMALRFARVLRYRPDKTPAQADTVGTVRRVHAR